MSETFIAQEIHALEQRGLNLCIVSLRHPTDPETHPVHASIRAPVLYLPEYLYREPIRVLRSWWRVRRRIGYRAALGSWFRDLKRDLTSNRVRRFGQALVLAAELPGDCAFIYVHFLHTPGSVARYASSITEVPWGCSAHAKDIWTTPDWEIQEKLSDCEWLVSCTAANVEHLGNLASDPSKVSLVYHGLDFKRFAEPRIEETKTAQPLVILSVGRAVEKKGYDILLDALAKLPSQIQWRFLHIGGGALQNELRKRAETLGIADKVEWKGMRSHEYVINAYRQADIFVLACCVASDGDRDGLPNVLMEAQSQKLPCVSTAVSGVPELIEDQVTGLLVEQQDSEALAAALQTLLVNENLRVQLGQAGFERVRERFSHEEGIDRIVNGFPAVCFDKGLNSPV